jgi:glycosyltransferase involved in cell wall biosynthesis
MIVVLMAAFNEEKALAWLLPRMPDTVEGHRVRTVVLSDGSSDRTVEVARKCGVDVVDFDVNRGKGAVLKAGIAAVAEEPFVALVMMDADGQHDPARLSAVATPVLEGSADIVIGSRYLRDGARGTTPWNRYAVRCTTRAVLGSMLSASTTDPFSGYRCLTPHAVQCLELQGDRYESELEMLFCAERRALRITEVPIPRIYGSDTSKMNARHGAVLGRLNVVHQYAATIIRGALGLYGPSSHTVKRTVSA